MQVKIVVLHNSKGKGLARETTRYLLKFKLIGMITQLLKKGQMSTGYR